MLHDPLYELPVGVVTRWASAENFDASPGGAAKKQFGRKGSPCVPVAAGETLTMAHSEGIGTLHRFWITIDDRSPELLRGLVIRIYWDGAEKPAVEAPIGDFFCCPLGRMEAFENAWFDTGEGRSFNCRIPMPFKTGFRMTVTNESPKNLSLFFYDVNWTLGDKHTDGSAYFHAHYRRENPTTLRRDFEILPKTVGRGRFLGCSIGVISDMEKYGKAWWGEGEVKAYIDNDSDYPTLCGTGTEDYIGTGWGQDRYARMWHGCPIADSERFQYGFYRLHGPDPIYFQESIKVTIQQIGGASVGDLLSHLRSHNIQEYVKLGDGSQTLTQADAAQKPQDEFHLIEREDDWCATAYFYLSSPINDLPPIENYESRVVDLTGA